MRKLIFLFITVLTVLMLTGCPAPDSMGYAIGDIGPSGVGIVFYLTDDGGLHGLEAAPGDQSAGDAYSNITNALVNGGTTPLPPDLGTGSANTDAIIAQIGHIASAALIAGSYTGGGVTDWFLPSKDELNELYLQKDSIGGFAQDYYWSSSESDPAFPDLAWGQFFQDGWNGMQVDDTKSTQGSVRAIRAF